MEIIIIECMNSKLEKQRRYETVGKFRFGSHKEKRKKNREDKRAGCCTGNEQTVANSWFLKMPKTSMNMVLHIHARLRLYRKPDVCQGEKRRNTLTS